MTHTKRFLPLALILLLCPIVAHAQSAAVPHTINLQSMVYDAEGKVTTSESVDMTIRIVDADNNVLFSEAQNGVVVVKGAINVNIGEASGGVPLDILDPSQGTRLIDIEIAGQSPFELMPLGALPYAMWAEKSLTVANDSIGSEQIINGSIKAEDIDPLAFSDISGQLGDGQLPASAATVGQLNAHINSTTAHAASAIVVSGNFVTFVAANVQEALVKLDAKLVDEIVNRQSGQTTLTTNFTTLQTLTSDINNIPGTLGEAKIDGAIARDSEVTTAISSHNHDAAYVNVGGDTMTGALSVPTPGVALPNPADVGGTLENHETRLDALEGAPVEPDAKSLTLTWVTNLDNASGGRLTGTDAASWSLSGVNTGDGKWVSITRSSITVPSGCIPMATGTVSPNVGNGEVSAFDYDDPAFLKVNYNGAGQRTVNFRVYGLGNDGEYDINIRIVAVPTSAADPVAGCAIP